MSLPFGSATRAWFTGRFGTPTAPQADGWQAIARGEDTLIAAPTGSGKTLAAFLWCLDDLHRRAAAGPLEERTQVVYVSPLKALSHDIHVNLETPLYELGAAWGASGRITCGARTGDTPARERAQMAKRPPHILVTTPESLYILLTTQRGQTTLAGVSPVRAPQVMRPLAPQAAPSS